MKKETTLSVLKEIRDLLKQGGEAVNVRSPDLWKVIDDCRKTSEILAECRSKFDVYSYYDEKRLDADFQPPAKETVRYFKKNIEADLELANKSANDLKAEGIEGITLRERLILELQYFKETGNHLDIDNWTLCSGSRNSDGNVPDVYWNSDDRRLHVDWSGADNRFPNLRARAAVSITL